MSLARNLAVATALLILSSRANIVVAQQFDPGALSLKLDQGMTTQQVIAALNYRPNSAEQETCGSSTSSPWSCRVWIFTDGTRGLKVLFRNEGGAWVVNSWFPSP
jgi:hypothetical protein